MNIKIRKSVFETNSSSIHSICISGSDRFSKFPNEKISVDFDEYGWGYDRLDTAHQKLSYVLTSIQYYDSSVNDEDIETLYESKYYVWLKEMVKDYCGCEINLEAYDSRWCSMGYVDHQSTDTLNEHWSHDESTFKENMKELIFNDKYTIIIDNDNH